MTEPEAVARLPELNRAEMRELAEGLDEHLRILAARYNATPKGSKLAAEYEERLEVTRSVATAVIEASYHMRPPRCGEMTWRRQRLMPCLLSKGHEGEHEPDLVARFRDNVELLKQRPDDE